MTDQNIINFKLELARAWLENGQEQLARGIIKTIIEAEAKDDSIQS